MHFPSRPRARARASTLIALLPLLITACATDKPMTEAQRLNDFATQYTAAWCSHKPASVASFFTADGSLQINQGAPAVGRPAITAAVRGFMTAFPDLTVRMGELTIDGARVTYHWTLIGTNTGPGGAGNHVQISGYEEWRFSADRHIAESNGHFDEADYQRQIKGAAAGA